MDRFLPHLVDRLLESYKTHGGINNEEGVPLPARAAIGHLNQALLHLLFPGFFENQEIHADELPLITASNLAQVQRALVVELRKSLSYRPIEHRVAEEVAALFLEQLPEIRRLLQTDVQAAFEGDPAPLSPDEIIVAYPCLEAIAVQRMAHVLYLQKVALIPRMMTEWAHSRTGIDIHPGAQIGSHFFIDHGTGVVIGETAEIGNEVRMYQGVSLGAKSLSRRKERVAEGKKVGGKRHPTIRDGVTVYGGATILGGDTVIGERSIIGGNVWLTHSVDPDSVVCLEDQQVIVRSRRDQEPNFEI